MIAYHIYVFFTSFGPNLVEKEEDEKWSFFARTWAVFVYDGLSHMQCFVIIVTVEDSWIGVEMSDLTPTSVLFVIG